MHQNKGKTILKCLAERTDYAMNGEKTANGELISSFECAPQTAASEFAFSKRIYFQKTGRYYSLPVPAVIQARRGYSGRGEQNRL